MKKVIFHLVLVLTTILMGCYPRTSIVKFPQRQQVKVMFEETYNNNSMRLNLNAEKFYKMSFSNECIKLDFQLSYHDSLFNRITVNLEDAKIVTDNLVLASKDYHITPFPIKTDSMYRDHLYFNIVLDKNLTTPKDTIYFLLSQAVLYDNKPLLPDTIIGVVYKEKY